MTNYDPNPQETEAAPGSGTPPPGEQINLELIEHRLNELGEKVEENRKDISAIKDAMVEVRIDLAEIKEKMNHVATKAWILGGVLGGMAIAATIAVTILKYWPG